MIRTLLILLISVLPIILAAQVITEDSSFPKSEFRGPTYFLSKMIYCPDGKMLVGGSFPYFNRNQQLVARLNEDGSFDSTFTPELPKALIIPDIARLTTKSVVGLAVQSDGKILVGINEPVGPTSAGYKLFRLNPDGSFDFSFKLLGTAEIPDISKVLHVAPRPDGKIFVICSFQNSTTIAILLNNDGTRDIQFVGQNISCYNSYLIGNLIKVQSDNKMLIKTCSWAEGVKRLNPDGSVDPTFTITTSILDGASVGCTALYRNKIYLGGNALYRLNSDGTLDSTFSTEPGFTPINTGGPGLRKIKVMPDSSLLLIGNLEFQGEKYTVITMTRDGKVITPYKLPPSTFAGFSDFLVTNSSQLLSSIGPYQKPSILPQRFLVRSKADGTNDTTFNKPVGLNGEVWSVVQDKNNNIIVGGDFSFYNDSSRRAVIRLLPNGKLDPTFNANNLNFTSGPNSILPLDDGRLLVGGGYHLATDPTVRISMLMADGRVDPSFTSNLTDASIKKILKLNDGFLTGGQGLNKILLNGVKDLAFTASQTNFSIIYNIGYDSLRDKIYCVGNFTKFGAANANRIVRTESNGTVDPTFKVGTAFEGANPAIQITALAIQCDGKIIAGGNFNKFNGTSVKYIVRLNVDGSLDTTFNAQNNWTDGYVKNLSLLKNGRILISGWFKNAGGETSIAILNSDGSLFPTENFTLEGYYGPMGALPFQSVIAMSVRDSSIMLGGEFIRKKGGGYQSFLAHYKIHNNDTLKFNGLSSAKSLCIGQPLKLSTNAQGPDLHFEWKKEGQVISKDSVLQIPSVAKTDEGIYQISVRDKCGVEKSATINVSIGVTTKLTEAPEDTLLCPGAWIKLTASAEGDSLEYQWRKESIVFVTNELDLKGQESLAGTYSVTAKGVCGSDTKSFTISTPPPIAAITQKNLFACEGTDLNLTVTLPGNQQAQCLWFKDNVHLGTGLNINIADVRSSDEGTYIARLTDVCQRIDSLSVLLDVGTKTRILNIPSDTAFCENSTATMLALATGENLKYSWSNEGTTIASTPALSLPNISSDKSGQYLVTVNGECGSTEKIVNVSVLQSTKFFSSPSDTMACPGSMIRLSTVAAGSNLRMSWLKNGETVNVGTTFSELMTSDLAGTYELNLSGACGYEKRTFALIQALKTEIITPLSDHELCEGNALTLSAKVQGENLHFEWLHGEVTVSSNAELSLNNITSTDSGTYRLRVSGTCGATVETKAHVAAIPLTHLVKFPNDTLVCTPTNLALHTVVTGRDVEYLWLDDGDHLGNSPDLFLKVIDNREHRLSFTAKGLCGTVSKDLTIYPLLKTQIIQPLSSVKVCEGDSARLFVEAEGAGLHYEWWGKGKLLASNDQSVFSLAATSPSVSGEYHVQVSGKCGAQVTSSSVVTVHPATSVFCKAEVGNKNPFPNPFGDFLFINLTESTQRPVEIKIIDQLGKTVRHMKPEVDEVNAQIKIEGLSMLTHGLYFVLIKSSSGWTQFKAAHFQN